MENYEVRLAQSVRDALMAISSEDDARRVAKRLAALAIAPHMGMKYDPIYESARPPHELYVTFAGHYGVYYTWDDARRAVDVEYLEDTRRDPMSKFLDLDA